MGKIKLLAGAAALGVLAACTPMMTAQAAVTWKPSGKLVFDENFSGTRLDKNWASSWFNGSEAEGVKTSSANVQVKGGDAILKLSSPGVGALIDTDPAQTGGHGFTFTAGYTVEADVYFSGHGDVIDNWPGFWTTSDTWPKQGEVDIAEGLGKLTNNYHSPSGAHNHGGPDGNWSGWHIFALDRLKGENKIYWDGKLIQTYKTDDNGGPEYIVFNVGAGSHTVTGTGGETRVAWVKAFRND